MGEHLGLKQRLCSGWATAHAACAPGEWGMNAFKGWMRTCSSAMLELLEIPSALLRMSALRMLRM